TATATQKAEGMKECLEIAFRDDKAIMEEYLFDPDDFFQGDSERKFLFYLEKVIGPMLDKALSALPQLTRMDVKGAMDVTGKKNDGTGYLKMRRLSQLLKYLILDKKDSDYIDIIRRYHPERFSDYLKGFVLSGDVEMVILFMSLRKNNEWQTFFYYLRDYQCMGKSIIFHVLFSSMIEYGVDSIHVVQLFFENGWEDSCRTVYIMSEVVTYFNNYAAYHLEHALSKGYYDVLVRFLPKAIKLLLSMGLDIRHLINEEYKIYAVTV
ncbi:MAG: hypothetical protein EBU03_03610, partial [Methylophilaceae bacterium]|nr:hypothetical protein [Methylophilaceae bacterium]